MQKPADIRSLHARALADPSDSSDTAGRPSRRDFVRTGAIAAAAGASAIEAMTARAADSKAGDVTINIGIVGTGGRGGGAANDTLSINSNVKLVAMADLYPEKCQSLRNTLIRKHSDKVAVPDDKIYGGLDAYKKVLDDPAVDVVLLTTSPGFRPYHIAEAVKAGKHVFAEKPTCVDPAGYRVCVAAHEEAEKNGTAIVTGTQYRRQTNCIDVVNRIHQGEIGDIVSATTRDCSGGIWYRGRKSDMSTAEYQLLNWYHFVWLSGDQITEQAVHNLDMINWVMQGPPENAYGSGGRFTRPEDSELWDNMCIDYKYPGDRILSFMCRQVPGADSDNGSVIYGTKATAFIPGFNGEAKIVDRAGKEIWSMKGDIGAAYQQEHKELIDSIRAGKPIVELKETAASSLTAVMGRLAAYTGKRVDWGFVTEKSELDLFQKDLAMDADLPMPKPAVPGVTKLV